MKKFNNIRRVGFTLAEVLITLGIIGVVASLTIPTLMQNADERANAAALKKTFSTLSSAYKLAEQEDGSPDTWGLINGNSPAMIDKIKPYLKVDKDCSGGGKGCFPTGVTYKSMAAIYGNWGTLDDWVYPKLKLTDGTLIMAGVDDPLCGEVYGTSQGLKTICGAYWVDVNGYKKPNQLGKDYFGFWLTKFGIVPIGVQQETSGYTFANDCKDRDNAYGLGCTAWIIYNDNMDFLRCKDLDWTTKTKCN